MPAGEVPSRTRRRREAARRRRASSPPNTPSFERMSPAANARPAARPRAGARAIRTRAPISTRDAATSAPSQIATAIQGGLAVGLGRVHEREREQDQSGHACDDRDLLAARQATRVAVCAEHRERRDPGRADALHERQRGEPKRPEIEDPADRLDAEAQRARLCCEAAGGRPPRGGAPTVPASPRRRRAASRTTS